VACGWVAWGDWVSRAWALKEEAKRTGRERVKAESSGLRLTQDAEVNEGPLREEDGRCCRAGLLANSPVADLRKGD